VKQLITAMLFFLGATTAFADEAYVCTGNGDFSVGLKFQGDIAVLKVKSDHLDFSGPALIAKAQEIISYNIYWDGRCFALWKRSGAIEFGRHGSIPSTCVEKKGSL
jgi:hypothetical protein